MDKMKKIMFCIITLLSCNEKNSYKKDSYDLIFEYSKWITVDFNSKELSVNRYGLKFINYLEFTPKEQNFIENSFTRNGLDKISSNINYLGENQIMPRVGFKITILKGMQKRNEIFIDWSCVKGIIPLGQKWKVLNFRDDIMKVLENNKSFIHATKLILKYQQDNGILRL